MEGLDVSVKDRIRILKFNKTQRKNAVNRPIYMKIAEILNEDANSSDTVATIITGEGDYFTSGNDIKAVLEHNDDRDFDVIANESNEIFKSFIQSMINYPKLLIAVVNGPAIGIGTTIVGLCDVVYASETAYFHAPFIHLGLCCEGCSSFTFPRIMGRSKASEILLLGKKLTAQEAFDSQLVSRVVPKSKLNELFEELKAVGKLPLQGILINKKLIQDGFREKLHDCNRRECAALRERSTSEDFFNAVTTFISRKSKL